MVYAEIVFLNAFVKELFVLSLLSRFLCPSRNKSPIFFISFIFGLFAIFYPLFPMNVRMIGDVSCLFIYPIIAVKKSMGRYLLFTVFCLLTFLIPFPFILSVIGLMFLQAIKIFSHNGSIGYRNYCICEICTGCRKVRTMAFFDSGNRVFAENGEPVVLADSSVYNRLEGAEDSVIIMTVTGMNTAPCKEGSVSILQNGRRVNYKVKVALSPGKLFHCGLILHGEMSGGL